MLKRLTLVNVGPAPRLDLELAPRLNLITGDNGLGKSFLLDVAWWALTRKWPRELNSKLISGYMARPSDPKQKASISFVLDSKTKSVTYESTYSPRDAGWVGRAGRPWNPGLVIYAHTDGGFSVWDPARNYWRTRAGMDVQDRPPAYVFSAQEVWDGLEAEIDGKPAIVCNGLVRDWAGWIKEAGPNAHNMEWVLRQLSPEFNPDSYNPADPDDYSLRPGPLVRMSVDDARDMPSLRTPYAAAVPILHASAGVRRIVALAYMLLWSWQEHRRAAELLGETATHRVVLLVDELESHLHPSWQRSILRSLLSAATFLHSMGARSAPSIAEVQLIAATHSPLILASAEPRFDASKDAWFDIDLDRTTGTVTLSRRIFVPHGDVSHWLTSEAFGLKSARSREGEAAIEKARALLRSRAPSASEARTIDEALHRAGLPDIDPFWVRWGKFLEDLGVEK